MRSYRFSWELTDGRPHYFQWLWARNHGYRKGAANNKTRSKGLAILCQKYSEAKKGSPGLRSQEAVTRDDVNGSRPHSKWFEAFRTQ